MEIVVSLRDFLDDLTMHRADQREPMKGPADGLDQPSDRTRLAADDHLVVGIDDQ